MLFRSVNRALIILGDILKFYENSEVDILYHIDTITLTMFNYTEWLGNLKRHTETIPIYEKALKMNVSVGRGKGLGGILYAKAWNLKKIDPSNIEDCQKCCRQAYYLASLVKEEKNKNVILKCGKSNFGDFIT